MKVIPVGSAMERRFWGGFTQEFEIHNDRRPVRRVTVVARMQEDLASVESGIATWLEAQRALNLLVAPAKNTLARVDSYATMPFIDMQLDIEEKWHDQKVSVKRLPRDV